MSTPWNCRNRKYIMKPLEKKRLLYVLMPLMAIYALGLWFVLGHNGANQNIIFANTAGPKDDAKFTARIIISLHKEDEITFKIQEMTLADEPDKMDVNYCIDTVYINFYEKSAYDYESVKSLTASSTFHKVQEPICFIASGGARYMGDEFTFPLHGNIYRYPYDSLIVGFSMQFAGDNKSEPYFKPVNNNYILDFTGREVEAAGIVEGIPQVTYFRPMVYRILTPMLAFCLFVFIIVSFFIQDIGAFCQVTVALLFGLWGAKQIIIPFSTNQVIFLDNVFLALYMLLGLVVLAWIISRIVSQYSEQRREARNAALLKSLVFPDQNATTSTPPPTQPTTPPPSPASAAPSSTPSKGSQKGL